MKRIRRTASDAKRLARLRRMAGPRKCGPCRACDRQPKCAWASGALPASFRPDLSGVIVKSMLMDGKPCTGVEALHKGVDLQSPPWNALIEHCRSIGPVVLLERERTETE